MEIRLYKTYSFKQNPMDLPTTQNRFIIGKEYYFQIIVYSLSLVLKIQTFVSVFNFLFIFAEVSSFSSVDFVTFVVEVFQSLL